MVKKHPKIWLVIYLVLCLWNIVAAVVPGGAPTLLSLIMATLMALCAVMCVRTIRRSQE